MTHIKSFNQILSLYDRDQYLHDHALQHEEINEASTNLLRFLELLIEIDQEHGITCAKGAGVQS